MYIRIGWHVKTLFIIEFSSGVILKWLLSREIKLWLLRSLFIGIDKSINQLVNVIFSVVKTQGNGLAVTLAIVGRKKNLEFF